MSQMRAVQAHGNTKSGSCRIRKPGDRNVYPAIGYEGGNVPSPGFYLISPAQWLRNPHEDNEAVTAGITQQIDVEIGLPIIHGPHVSGCVHPATGLPHHGGKAWWRVFAIQRIAVVQ